MASRPGPSWAPAFVGCAVNSLNHPSGFVSTTSATARPQRRPPAPERNASEQAAPPVAQRATLLHDRAEVRERAGHECGQHEHDREPGAVVHADRVALPVIRQARPGERPDRDAEPGPAAEQQRRRALDARPPEREPEDGGDPADEHTAARVGQRQPDDQPEDVDDSERPQPVRVLAPCRQPERERQRHREEQRERVPVTDRARSAGRSFPTRTRCRETPWRAAPSRVEAPAPPPGRKPRRTPRAGGTSPPPSRPGPGRGRRARG